MLMNRYYAESNRSNHFFLLALTIGVFAFTLTAFMVYESSYKIEWFHAAYIANATGILLAAWVSIPRLVHFLSIAEEKISPSCYYEPVLGTLALIPFILTFIVHCDQWNAAQPFVGQSIQLIILSLLLLVASGIAGFITIFRTDPKLDQLKMDKTSYHLPLR